MRQYFDNQVVRIHPRAQALQDEAWQRQHVAEIRLTFFLTMLFLFVFSRPWLSQAWVTVQYPGSWADLWAVGIGFLFFFSVMGLFVSDGHFEARDYLVWKIPVARLSPVVEELRVVGKEVFGFENPDQIFSTPFETLESLGEGILVRMASDQLTIESQITAEVRSPELRTACKQILNNNRTEMGRLYDRLVAARIIIKRDKALGYFFEVAREAN